MQRKRPVWQDPVTTLTSYSFPSGHATGIAAAAGVMIVLADAARTAPRPAPYPLRRSPSAWRCWSGSTGSSSGCTTSPTCSPATRSARSGCWSGWRLRPGAAGQAARGRSATPVPTHAEARGGPEPDQGRGRRRVPGDGGAPRAAAAGWNDADLVRDHRSRTRAARWPSGRGLRRRAGDRVRRRRHGPHGVRRARRHRRLGRRGARRHRQPAGPQPRHPALPAGRGRRRAATARTGPSTWSRSPATGSATTSTTW